MSMNVSYDVLLNIKNLGTTKTGIKLTQNDSGIQFRIKIIDGDNIFDSSGSDLTIAFLKPDQMVVIGDLIKDGDLYIYNLTGNELTKTGNVVCDIKATYIDGRVSSSKFVFEVENDTINENAIDSTTYIQKLDNLLSDANDIIIELENEYAPRLTLVESDLSFKADKTYVDISVNSVASGSPKGVYATLSDLQAAYPTGNTNTYIVTANGNWYYWSGSLWTAGGVYQSAGLSDGMVKFNTASKGVQNSIFKDFSMNIKDFYGAIALNASGAEISANSKFLTCGYIDKCFGKITLSNISYTSTYLLYGIYYYDKNMTYISSVAYLPVVNNTIILDETIDYKYIRLTILTSTTTSASNITYWNANSTFTLNFKKSMATTIGNLITVAKNDGDHTSIQRAIQKCSNVDAVIQVYPGTYIEKLNTQDDAFGNKNVVKYINGIDRDKCMVVYHNNAYGQDTLYVGVAHIKNMSFISDIVGYEGATGCAYALHLDNNWFVGKKVTFENCYFYAQLNAAVGIGTRPNCDIVFRNCIFESEVENFGTVFFHNSNDAGNLGANQKLTFIDCTFTSKNSYPMYIQRVRDDTNTIELTISNCKFYSEATGIADPIFINDSLYTGASGNNINITGKTFGNNINITDYIN